MKLDAQKALPFLRDGASVILVGSADADKLGRAGTSIYRYDRHADHHPRGRPARDDPRAARRSDHQDHSAEAPRHSRRDGQGRAEGEHPEWAGTTLTWNISNEGGVTVVRFTHSGWKFCP